MLNYVSETQKNNKLKKKTFKCNEMATYLTLNSSLRTLAVDICNLEVFLEVDRDVRRRGL